MGKRGRRLVHNQHARVRGERTGYFNQLLLGTPETIQRRQATSYSVHALHVSSPFLSALLIVRSGAGVCCSSPNHWPSNCILRKRKSKRLHIVYAIICVTYLRG